MTDPSAPTPDYDHYEDCPAHPDYEFAREPCRCAAINAEEEAYSAEPRNMASLEDGSATTPLW